jgi:hypothetical protein
LVVCGEITILHCPVLAGQAPGLAWKEQTDFYFFDEIEILSSLI